MAAARPSPLSLGLAPLILRLVLGITFVWAGLGKWLGTMPVKGEDAALLANLGVLTLPGATPATPAATPAKPLPSSRARVPAPALGLLLAQASEPQTPPGASSAPVPVTAAPPLATAADFPDDVPVRTIWMIAVALHHAAHPAPDAAGATPMPLWPRTLGEGLWLKVFAWMVLAAELGGGAGLLIGLFTRLWAMGIVCTMGVAMWLTQFGPAIQSGHARWGFLPGFEPFGQEWQTLGWQLALFAMALAVALLGSGALAIDRAIGGFSSPPARSSGAGGSGG